MCDAMSFISAYGSYSQGRAAQISSEADAIFATAQATDRRSQLDLEAAQLEAMSVLAAARGSRDEARLRKAYAEQTRQNVAAAAISGFAPESFDAIAQGNARDMAENLEAIQTDIDLERFGLESEAREARRGGANVSKMARYESAAHRAAGRAALWSGIGKAVGTLGDAERTYRETNTGQSRGRMFMQSITGNY